MIKQELISRLVREREKLLSSVEWASDEEMLRPMAEGKWAMKDVLSHIAAWEGEAVRAFEQKARGERPTMGDIPDIDAWNKREVEKRKDSSVTDIRRELDETRTRLLEILNALPDEGKVWEAERMTPRLVNMLINHDGHHSKQLGERRSEQ